MTKKVALITGGASGIGKATAFKLSKENYFVVIMDRNEQLLQETMTEISSSGGEVRGENMDVTNLEAIQLLFSQWPETYGRLDVLINNAATSSPSSLIQTEPEIWDLMMDVNLKSVYLLCKHAHPLLRESQGSVLNVSSVMGYYVYTNNTAYCISKAGLNHMTKVLAKEWLVDKIRVNAILPSTVDTPLLKDLSRDSKSYVERINQGLQDGTVQTSEQIADVVYLLTRPEASIITGQCIVADAGSQLR